MIDCKQVHPNFGAEVENVSLRSLTDESVPELREALAKYGLLIFRDQCLSDEELVRVGRTIGNGALEPSARRISHGPTHNEVVYLSNLLYPDGSNMGFPGNDTDYWHSDQEFRENPAILASIYCIIPSPVGGETSFAGTAIDTLPLDKDDVDAVRGRWSTRVPAVTHDNVPKVEVAHPAILRNPLTGREYLYISENLVRFIDLPEDDSGRLKARFMSAILEPDNIYAHQWRPGDYLLYDNGQVIHRREAFEGPRLLKATKIYAQSGSVAVPDGRVIEQLLEVAD